MKHISKRGFLWVLGTVLILVVGLYLALVPTGIWVREVCAQKLDRTTLEQSLQAGRQYLLHAQRKEGNFVYEYDWVSRKESAEDNQVRQAGAVWGLALYFHHEPRSDVEEALERSLAFYARNSKTLPGGALAPSYPGSENGELGTVALLNLAYIDYLRSAEGRIPEERLQRHRKQLDGLMMFLLSLRNQDGLFHSYFDLKNGKPYGEPNPYGDGESMLAMAKMARYLGREDLKVPLKKALETGYKQHVVEARKLTADSDETKGFYQWSTMAFYEASTAWPEFAAYGDHAVELGDWMIDTHNILWRTRNTAYAFEGILHAMALAESKGDEAHAARFRCVAGQGLEKLTSWQVGGPIPNKYIQKHAPWEDRAVGAVQNEKDAPGLRIDVTQHQMHAVMLALKWLYPPEKK